jgi:toxin FitB
MRYLLDTSILSEFAKPKPNKGLLEWLEATPEQRLYMSVVTLGELQQGISQLPVSADRQRVQTWLDDGLRVRFGERLLALGSEEWLLWGHLRGSAAQKGFELPALDGLIAATALYHRLVLVTRNESMFSKLSELQVINPFAGK